MRICATIWTRHWTRSPQPHVTSASGDLAVQTVVALLANGLWGAGRATREKVSAKCFAKCSRYGDTMVQTRLRIDIGVLARQRSWQKNRWQIAGSKMFLGTRFSFFCHPSFCPSSLAAPSRGDFLQHPHLPTHTVARVGPARPQAAGRRWRRQASACGCCPWGANLLNRLQHRLAGRQAAGQSSSYR